MSIYTGTRNKKKIKPRPKLLLMQCEMHVSQPMVIIRGNYSNIFETSVSVLRTDIKFFVQLTLAIDKYQYVYIQCNVSMIQWHGNATKVHSFAKAENILFGRCIKQLF
jgi:hypothetical protein